jgi:O-antigen ligase
MATVLLTHASNHTHAHIDTDVDDRHGWGFAVLLGTMVTLFLRPADLFPQLENWPIYQCLILACLAVSARSVVRQFRHRELIHRPVTACLLLLMVAIGVSHLSHGFIWAARMSMFEFSKSLAFYLLMVALINTPRRLVMFAKLLTVTIATVAFTALLDRYNWISIAAFESIRDRASSDTENPEMIDRLRGTGIFQDPNDFGLILVLGCTLCLGFMFRPRAGWWRYVWLLPTVVLLVAFSLTYSRGAMLSMACVLPAVLAYRSGAKVAFASLMLLPVIGLAFSSRMTDVSAMEQGTGQSRIQIWSDSLMIWSEYPLFGIGEGMLVEELNVVSHNSYIQCYAELGAFGGTAFLASFLAAGLTLWSLKHRRKTIVNNPQSSRADTDLPHLQMYVFACLTAYAFGMLTLSRQLITPTYLVLGFATASQKVTCQGDGPWRINNRFMFTALACSALFLLTSHLIVRLLVRW